MFNKNLILLLQFSCIFGNALTKAQSEPPILQGVSQVLVSDAVFIKMGTYSM